VVGHEEAVAVLAPLAEADAGAVGDAGMRIAGLSRPQAEASAQQARAVVFELDAERLA
jgi:hypothetical protein